MRERGGSRSLNSSNRGLRCRATPVQKALGPNSAEQRKKGRNRSVAASEHGPVRNLLEAWTVRGDCKTCLLRLEDTRLTGQIRPERIKPCKRCNGKSCILVA